MKGFLMTGVIVLIMVVATSGCISSDNAAANQIKLNVLQAVNNITSYRFTMEYIMETTIDYEGVSTTTMSLTVNGAVDVANNKLMMEMDSVYSGDSGEMDISYVYYFVDEIAYMYMEYLGEEQWIKINLPEYNLSQNNYDQMQMQADLLADACQVELLNDEAINSVNCYVLKIVPDVDKIFETIINQHGINTGTSQSNLFSDMMDEFTIKLWIAKDTYYMMKAYYYVSMEMSLYGYSYSANLENTVLITDYNEPVTIDPPEEAIESAIDYSSYLENLSSSVA